MSIVVNGLVKQYGDQKAVNNISFSVDNGEIVGFLGLMVLVSQQQ